MKKNKLVIFDMDGVLVDSEYYWEILEEKFFKVDLGIENDFHKKITGLSLEDVYIKILEEINIPLDYEVFLKKYNLMAEEVYKRKAFTYNGVDEVIQHLKNNNFKIVIATSSPREWVDMLARRFKIFKEFDLIVSCPENNFPGKPNSRVYEFIISKMRIETKNAIAIEDSANGIKSAKGAGLKCLAFLNGTNGNQNLSRADKTFSNFNQLYKIIENENF